MISLTLRHHLHVLRRVPWLTALAAAAPTHRAAAAEPADDPLAQIRAARLDNAEAASALAEALLDAGDAALDRIIGALRPPGEPERGASPPGSACDGHRRGQAGRRSAP